MQQIQNSTVSNSMLFSLQMSHFLHLLSRDNHGLYHASYEFEVGEQIL